MNRYLIREASMLIEWELRQGHSLSKIARKCNQGHSTIIDEGSTTSYRGKYMASAAIEKVKKNIANWGIKLKIAQH